jgi:hypothetical protein
MKDKTVPEEVNCSFNFEDIKQEAAKEILKAMNTLKMTPKNPIKRYANASNKKENDINKIKENQAIKKCSLCGGVIEVGFINSDNLCVSCLDKKYEEIKNGHHPV